MANVPVGSHTAFCFQLNLTFRSYDCAPVYPCLRPHSPPPPPSAPPAPPLILLLLSSCSSSFRWQDIL